ncbi:hypothetical protein QTG54_007764 [Skeletonema marinoi]|uniref:Uncharacterized protein n=1 Tax=Skeletonema marinoi TaxID=267567 RepID=A0AAD8Y9K7_9STRA|nr:hypothetical protein QTG54_007764 [Skeletonema marinoi]
MSSWTIIGQTFPQQAVRKTISFDTTKWTLQTVSKNRQQTGTDYKGGNSYWVNKEVWQCNGISSLPSDKYTEEVDELELAIPFGNAE